MYTRHEHNRKIIARKKFEYAVRLEAVRPWNENVKQKGTSQRQMKILSS